MHFSSVQQEAVRTAVPACLVCSSQGKGVWPPSLELVHKATLLLGMQSACLSSPCLWLSLCLSPWNPLGTRVTFFQSWNGGFCFYDTFHAHITMETRVCARMCLRAGRERPYLPRHCGVSPTPVPSLCMILNGRDHRCHHSLGVDLSPRESWVARSYGWRDR